MPIRKKGDVEIQASANGTKVKQTGYTFYSYDKNAAALYFQFRGQDGQPTDLGKATIHLVMILNDDGGKEFIPKSDEIEVISAIRGTAKYVLPEMLLSYSGKVTGYVYMDFDDGSQSDDGQFTFRIKQSMITHVLPEAGDKYVQDFEDVKERVEQAGDSATKDIEKAKDNAESQIGDYVGEVEKDYKEWKEKQEDKQSKFEADTNERVNKITERVGEAENKVSDLESNLDVAQKNYFSIRDWQKRPDSTLTSVPIMKIQVEKNQKYTLSSNIEPRTDGAANIFLTHGDRDKLSSSIDGVYPDQPKTITAQDDGVIIVGIRNIDITEPDLWIMLNKGEYAAKWTPNTNDIVTVRYRNEIETIIENHRKNIGFAINLMKPPYNAKSDGKTDDTSIINQAIQDAKEGTTIYFPKGSGNYIINGDKSDLASSGGLNLEGKKNLTFLFEEGASLESHASSSNYYSLFFLRNSKGITFINMSLKGDRSTHVGSTGEWGHGIQMYHGSENIKIINGYAQDFLGDGFYIRGGKNIIINNTISHNNRRQGLSIVSGENILIKHSKFTNTDGTTPQSGVDVEPSGDSDLIRNIEFDGCVFTGNNGKGLLLYGVGGVYENVRVINCKMERNSEEDIRLTGESNSLKNIKIENNVINFISIGIHTSKTFMEDIKILDNEINKMHFRRCKNAVVKYNTFIKNAIFIDLIEDLDIIENIFPDKVNEDQRLTFGYASSEFYQTIKRVNIFNNRIKGGNSLIKIINDSEGINIKNNILTGSNKIAIDISAKDVLIKDNHIKHGTGAIQLQSYVTNALVSDNTLKDVEGSIVGSGVSNSTVTINDPIIWE